MLLKDADNPGTFANGGAVANKQNTTNGSTTTARRLPEWKGSCRGRLDKNVAVIPVRHEGGRHQEAACVSIDARTGYRLLLNRTILPKARKTCRTSKKAGWSLEEREGPEVRIFGCSGPNLVSAAEREHNHVGIQGDVDQEKFMKDDFKNGFPDKEWRSNGAGLYYRRSRSVPPSKRGLVLTACVAFTRPLCNV